jgi:hypothetical protein
VLLDEEVPKNCSCTSDDNEDGVDEHRGGVATPDFAAELHPDASLNWTTAGQEYTEEAKGRIAPSVRLLRVLALPGRRDLCALNVFIMVAGTGLSDELRTLRAKSNQK